MTEKKKVTECIGEVFCDDQGTWSSFTVMAMMAIEIASV